MSENGLRAAIGADAERYGAAAGSLASVLAAHRNPGLRMTTAWRVAQRLQQRRVPVVPQLIRQHLVTGYGCDWSLRAQVDGGVRVPHPVGIVIGDDVRVARGGTLMQNVTLGGNFGRADEAGRMTPTLDEDVHVGPGAVVVGPVTVGRRARVAANAVVVRDVEAWEGP